MNNRKSRHLNKLLESLFLQEQAIPVQYPQSTQEFAPNTQPLVKPSSLDQAVDGYLVQYEKESIPLSNQPIPPATLGPVPQAPIGAIQQESHRRGLAPRRNSSLFSIIFLGEQTEPGTEEEEEPVDDEAPADEAPMDDEGGEETPAPDQAAAPAPTDGVAMPVQATPKIDLNSFAQSVARLVGNYQSLIDPKTLIINRAEQFIASNYDEKTAKDLMTILDSTYDIRPQEVGATEDTTDASRYPTNYTVGGLATG